LLGILFDPEDGGSIFFINVSGLLPDYMVLISQKIVLFAVNAVRTSSSTCYELGYLRHGSVSGG
jgi:hypothetical protein